VADAAEQAGAADAALPLAYVFSTSMRIVSLTIERQNGHACQATRNCERHVCVCVCV
jgi:hypothetical protein